MNEEVKISENLEKAELDKIRAEITRIEAESFKIKLEHEKLQKEMKFPFYRKQLTIQAIMEEKRGQGRIGHKR